MQTHSRTLGGAQGILQKSGEKDLRAIAVKETTRKLIESMNLGSKGLTDIEQIIREPTWD